MEDRQGNTFSFQLTTKDTDDLTQVEEISMGRYDRDAALAADWQRTRDRASNPYLDPRHDLGA